MNLKLQILLLSLMTVVSSSNVNAQPNPDFQGGTITGTILDETTKSPLAYVNVLLMSVQDSTVKDGTLSNEEGKFNLTQVKPGKYYLKLQFIGYHDKIVNSIQIGKGSLNAKLGEILVEQSVIETEGIEVSGERLPITYQIDKKVVNVSKQLNATSGTAVDVLENVPSVTVDIEGNVTMRGSSNFKVLIDGRPTIMDANDALQSIPANTIEDIEIITNPSAKYEAEGISGIINVVLKKESRNGYSGIFNANAGSRGKYGADILLTKRMGDFGVIVGAEYMKRGFDGSRYEERTTTYDSITTNSIGEGEMTQRGNPIGARASVDYNITKNDLVTLGARFRKHTMEFSNTSEYEKWTNDNEHEFYTSKGSSNRSGDWYNTSLDYSHYFDKQEHSLSANLSYNYGDMGDTSETKLLDLLDVITSGKRTSESSQNSETRFNIDYALPLTEQRNFEAGIQGRMRNNEEESDIFEYETSSNSFVLNETDSRTVTSIDNTYSAYMLYSDKIGKFGYKGGLRTEITDRNITYEGETQSYNVDEMDLFPSLHLSYQLSENHQIMTSYSRRIDRPHGWLLEPFQTWMDAYNVREGNPSLKSEYINSLELGYSTNWKQNLFSVEGFYRVTENLIDEITSVYDTNVTLRRPENVGTQYDMGAEVMLNLKFTNWWSLNLTSYIFDSRIEIDNKSDENSKLSWNARFSNDFKITPSTKLQLSAFYNGPRIRAQGTQKAFLMSNAAIKQEFFDKKLSVTLQARDLFGSGNWENETTGDGFRSYSKFSRITPDFNLTLTYNINDYKPDRKKSQANGDDSDSDVQIQY